MPHIMFLLRDERRQMSFSRWTRSRPLNGARVDEDLGTTSVAENRCREWKGTFAAKPEHRSAARTEIRRETERNGAGPYCKLANRVNRFFLSRRPIAVQQRLRFIPQQLDRMNEIVLTKASEQTVQRL